MDKKIIKYNIPIQDKKQIDDFYKMCKDIMGEDFEPTEKYLTTGEHIDILTEKFVDAIIEVGNDGGWYYGDGIKIKIEIEYEPESK